MQLIFVKSINSKPKSSSQTDDGVELFQVVETGESAHELAMGTCKKSYKDCDKERTNAVAYHAKEHKDKLIAADWSNIPEKDQLLKEADAHADLARLAEKNFSAFCADGPLAKAQEALRILQSRWWS